MIGLGATVDRAHLTNDYLIATKVAAVGYFLLGGLYVSSLSSCLGAIYATPRIIQNMASERILPGSKYLSKGQGPNKVPVVALLLFAVVTFAFIMIQKINVLATIVTIPFLMTYASVEYAYFSLAMSFDIIQKRENRFGASSSAVHKGTKDYGAFRVSNTQTINCHSDGDPAINYPTERNRHAFPGTTRVARARLVAARQQLQLRAH